MSLWDRHSFKHLMYINSLNITTPLWGRHYYYYSDLPHENTRVQRDKGTCQEYIEMKWQSSDSDSSGWAPEAVNSATFYISSPCVLSYLLKRYVLNIYSSPQAVPFSWCFYRKIIQPGVSSMWWKASFI